MASSLSNTSLSNTSLSNTQTSILPIDARRLGNVTAVARPDDILDDFHLDLDPNSPDAARLQLAAEQLRDSDIPVAFPTETVYGLGADATRSVAVQGIYRAKQRPADNPLIVHFASLDQLRRLLRHGKTPHEQNPNGILAPKDDDPIPAIYHPLITRFWPGPLTLILPNPPNSPLASEVTAGLSTFGARIPRHILALSLIKLCDRPIAAPSANASTKPSPTAAEHVAFDLQGRIETIVDGGPCDVGVESTVVDGSSDPPSILRPGGVSIEQIRECAGWERTVVGYRNSAEGGDDGKGDSQEKPRAPGMKYRHYSPKAPVVLCEVGKALPRLNELEERLGSERRLGVISTRTWFVGAWNSSSNGVSGNEMSAAKPRLKKEAGHCDERGFAGMLKSLDSATDARSAMRTHHVKANEGSVEVLEIALGSDTADIARGIFSALRELDRANVDTIIVEGIDDAEGDTAAAIMNRLRKAAEIKVSS